MRILDLGCGTGTNLAKLGVTESDEVTGVDIDDKVLAIARHRFPRRAFFVGAGEKLPFDNASFDRVISNVALPYMDIPKTLLEIHRVLVPGGPSLAQPSSRQFYSERDSEHVFSFIVAGVPTLCVGERCVVPLHRKDSMVCERANRVLSDRARNEDRTPARGIHKCHFCSARATGRKEADCAGNKDRLDVKRSRALVADAGLNPRFKFHCNTQPHISNCWLPAAI